MKELNLLQTREINGGVAPLVYGGYLVGAYALGWIGGYVEEKYNQYKDSKREAEANKLQ